MPEEMVRQGRILRIVADEPQAKGILKALASQPRLRMLEFLSDRLCNVSEIAAALDLPLSTTTRDLTILENAGLIHTELTPAIRGLQKMCSRVYDIVSIELPSHGNSLAGQQVKLSMPIGAYVDVQATPTCGLVSDAGVIGLLDDPASFYEPDRIQAQLLWFHYGYVEYRFPNRLPPGVVLDSLNLSMEICSEAPLHHDDWPSDITLWLNGVEIGKWTSPADFGGRRGLLTPAWWEDRNTQYGLLKLWQVSEKGSFVDGVRISAVSLADLHITEHNHISMRIGVKPDADRVGGINIFGSAFGNYPQDIVLSILYH